MELLGSLCQAAFDCLLFSPKVKNSLHSSRVSKRTHSINQIWFVWSGINDNTLLWDFSNDIAEAMSESMFNYYLPT